MEIVVIVRTLNEERNIERFCQSYQWADRILVADGGSDDNTVHIAANQAKTFVTYFRDKVTMMSELWRNDAGEHINYLIDWAEAYNPDWIIFDDCDCVPNEHLKYHAREVFEESSADVVNVVRLYLWGENQYFPEMSFIKKKWRPSLWAWRPRTKMKFKTNKINHTHEIDAEVIINSKAEIALPSCLLHRAWPDEETVKDKLDFYRNSGQHPTIKHPLEYAGALKPLPEWAVE